MTLSDIKPNHTTWTIPKDKVTAAKHDPNVKRRSHVISTHSLQPLLGKGRKRVQFITPNIPRSSEKVVLHNNKYRKTLQSLLSCWLQPKMRLATNKLMDIKIVANIKMRWYHDIDRICKMSSHKTKSEKETSTKYKHNAFLHDCPSTYQNIWTQ